MAIRDRLRRTMMFLPGNNPSMITDAHIYKPDSIMIDLEDAVSVNQKDAARFLVSEALKAIDYKTTERVVRVNGLDTPFGADDIRAIVKAGVDVIRLPKTDNPDEIVAVDKLITEVEREIGREGETLLMAAIESAAGIMNVKDIALAKGLEKSQTFINSGTTVIEGGKVAFSNSYDHTDNIDNRKTAATVINTGNIIKVTSSAIIATVINFIISILHNLLYDENDDFPIENIVYIELLSRGYEVKVGKVKDKEINFIAKKEKDLSYYQISYKIRDEKTRERIYETYNSITDNFPKYVLSMDHSNFSQDGIIHKNIIDFLLEDEGVK